MKQDTTTVIKPRNGYITAASCLFITSSLIGLVKIIYDIVTYVVNRLSYTTGAGRYNLLLSVDFLQKIFSDYWVLSAFYLILLIFAVFLLFNRTKITSVIFSFILMLLQVVYFISSLPGMLDGISACITALFDFEIVNNSTLPDIVLFTLIALANSISLIFFIALICTIFLLVFLCILNIFFDEDVKLPWFLPNSSATLSLILLLCSLILNIGSLIIYYVLMYIFSSDYFREMVLSSAIEQTISLFFSEIFFSIPFAALVIGLKLLCRGLNKCTAAKYKKVIIHVMED